MDQLSKEENERQEEYKLFELKDEELLENLKHAKDGCYCVNNEVNRECEKHDDKQLEMLKEMEDLPSGLNQKLKKSEEEFCQSSKQGSNKWKEERMRLQNKVVDVKEKMKVVEDNLEATSAALTMERSNDAS